MKLISVYGWEPRLTAVTILYDWLKERSEEEDEYVNISHRALPPYQEHINFFTNRPYRFWEFVCVPLPTEGDYGPIGYVSAGFDNTVGIILERQARGMGYGPEALKLFIDTHDPLPAKETKRPGSWIANINPRNERSIAVFSKAGFTHLQNTYILEK